MISLLSNIYLASGIGFLASLIRDSCLISASPFSKDFFQLLYVSSFAATFAINAITLSKFPPSKNFVMSLGLLSLFLLCFVWSETSLRKPYYFFLLIGVHFSWILGSYASRVFLHEGDVLIARIRDALSSFLTVPLIFYGLGLGLTYLLPNLIVNFMYLASIKKRKKSLFFVNGIKFEYKQFFSALLFSNLANSCMLIWAMYFNGSHEATMLGFDSVLSVRFSVYMFQFLTLASITLLAHTPTFLKRVEHKKLSIIVGFVIFAIPLSFYFPDASVIFMPVIASVSHYASILKMHKN